MKYPSESQLSEILKSEERIKKLEKLKLQVMAQNPSIMGVPVPNVKIEKKLNGMMVYYIDVGQLPPHKAEAFIERVKEQFHKKNLEKRLESQGIESVFIPVRPNSETRVQFIPTSEEGIKFAVKAATFKAEDVEIFEQ